LERLAQVQQVLKQFCDIEKEVTDKRAKLLQVNICLIATAEVPCATYMSRYLPIRLESVERLSNAQHEEKNHESWQSQRLMQ
jgi:hypothetical protein